MMPYLKKVFLNQNAKKYLILTLVFILSLDTKILFAVDSNSDNIDDSLVVSIAASGVQSFSESDAGSTNTLSEINFNSSYTATGLTNGSNISARNISSNSNAEVATGSGTLSLVAANVFGGAGNTGNYAQPGTNESTSAWTITFTNTQRYVGLWWSAGNAANNLQLQDANGNNLLSPVFTTAAVQTTALDGNSCPSTRPTAAQITDAPWRGYCSNPNSGTTYVAEPYAFIHIRYETGFRKLKFWGTGFEFDNLTFSETIPAFGATEEVVGDLSVSTNLPDVLLVDPRATFLNFPSLALSNSNNAMICFRQVADSSGTAISGAASISINRTSNTTGVTENTSTNLWRYNGTRANVQTQTGSIRISGVGTNPVVNTGSKWLEVHVTSRTSAETDCTTNIQIRRRVELRSLGLDTTRRITVGVD